MNPEVKDKWVKALRSGDYKQTSGQLRDHNGYCCLGVLCELYREETKRGGWDKLQRDQASTPVRVGYKVGGYMSVVLPPPSVIGWSGLGSSNPEVKFDGKVTSLPELNDSGKTFEEIADVIEKSL